MIPIGYYWTFAPIGEYKKPFFGKRPIPQEICNRMKCNTSFGDNHVQIQVPFLGEMTWINIRRVDLARP